MTAMQRQINRMTGVSSAGARRRESNRVRNAFEQRTAASAR